MTTKGTNCHIFFSLNENSDYCNPLWKKNDNHKPPATTQEDNLLFAIVSNAVKTLIFTPNRREKLIPII